MLIKIFVKAALQNTVCPVRSSLRKARKPPFKYLTYICQIAPHERFNGRGHPLNRYINIDLPNHICPRNQRNEYMRFLCRFNTDTLYRISDKNLVKNLPYDFFVIGPGDEIIIYTLLFSMRCGARCGAVATGCTA